MGLIKEWLHNIAIVVVVFGVLVLIEALMLGVFDD